MSEEKKIDKIKKILDAKNITINSKNKISVQVVVQRIVLCLAVMLYWIYLPFVFPTTVVSCNKDINMCQVNRFVKTTFSLNEDFLFKEVSEINRAVAWKAPSSFTNNIGIELKDSSKNDNYGGAEGDIHIMSYDTSEKAVESFVKEFNSYLQNEEVSNFQKVNIPAPVKANLVLFILAILLALLARPKPEEERRYVYIVIFLGIILTFAMMFM